MIRPRKLGALVAVLLMVSVSFQTAVASAYEDGNGEGSRVAPLEEIPGPFRELDELVAGLIEVTTDTTDTDADGIPDTVETVIGTNPEHSDSDFDTVPDMAEVANRTDPMSADSNRDGLVDSLEVYEGVTDSDGDGTPNWWDSDNDGDGIRDERDVSPFAATATGDSHRITVSSRGYGTTVNLQLRTQDPATMALIRQTWDWPYDTQGAMRDLDNSTVDVTCVPILMLEGKGLPVDEELAQYGIVVASDVAYVPLYPIDDYGETVALQGQMFLPASSAPGSITLDAKLVWKVTGKTDTPVVALQASNNRFLSLHANGYIFADGRGVGPNERFRAVDLNDGKYALRASNGLLLSSTFGSAVSASATEINDNTVIEFEPRGDGKYSMHMELYDDEHGVEFSEAFFLAVHGEDSRNVLEADYGDYRADLAFTWTDMGVVSDYVPLAAYPDRFALTGVYVQEEFGTDLALVYRNDSMERAVAANMYLAYQFLRNATNGVTDIPRLFASMDAATGVILASYARMDLAVQALAETLMSAAKAGFPEGMLLPVMTCVEQRYTQADLAYQGQGRLGDGGSLAFDVASEPPIVKRYLKTTWFNGTQNESVPVERAIWEMRDWDLTPEDLSVMVSLVIYWSAGEEAVISVGPKVIERSIWEIDQVINNTWKIIGYGVTAVKGIWSAIYYGSMFLYTAYQVIVNLGNIVLTAAIQTLFAAENILDFELRLEVGLISLVADTIGGVMSATSGFFGTLNTISNILKWSCVIGLVLGIGAAIISFFAISASYGWTGLGIYTAAITGIMLAAYTIITFVLTLLSFIPYVGIVFTIISTILSVSDLIVWAIFGKGWTTMLTDLIIDVLTDVTVLTEYTVVEDKIDVTIDDKDRNGLDVGDRITYSRTWDVSIAPTGVEAMTVQTTHLRHVAGLSVPPYATAVSGTNTQQGVAIADGSGGFERTTTSTAWAEPGMAMVNYPVTIFPRVDYAIMYEEAYWLFGWHREWKYSNGTVYADPMTLYFDVMPGSVGDFMRWREIRSSDEDGDGVADMEESSFGYWSWDGDGDGLGDSYERDIGTDPVQADGDHDGLDDKWEHIYRTDPRKKDSDGDGLTDRFENGGWVVDFTYCGKEFASWVYSDPLVNDTDGDGLTDREEWLTLQNPRTSDTDADGAPDALRDYQETTFENLPPLFTGEHRGAPTGIAMGPDGCLYVAVGPFDLRAQWVQKYSPDGTLLREWGGDGVFWNLNGIEVDSRGDVYVCDQEGGIMKFDANGTALATYGKQGGPGQLTYTGDIVIDENGTIFVVDEYGAYPDYLEGVKVYDRNGTFLREIATTGSSGHGLYAEMGGLAIDAQGLLHFTDVVTDRVHVMHKNGSYVRYYDGRVPGGEPFESPIAVAFDKAGDVFVVEGMSNRVQKCDPMGRWMATYDGNMTPNGTELWSSDIIVTADDVVFLTDYNYGGIYKFHQNISIVKAEPKPFPDTDGDGLLDVLETTPWTINITTEAAGTVPLVVTSDPVAPDTDLDGLGDAREHELGTDPRSIDTDADGAPDAMEADIGTNPCDFDTDRDGLADGVELALGTDPQDGDTDGEGVTDREELLRGSDPRSNDTDRDGMDDWREVAFGSNLTDADSDDDCMFDAREADVGALPDKTDFDDDGIQDGYEDLYGTDAIEGDTDGDELPDGLEVAMRIDPLSDDTDDDGVTDSAELEQGLNPKSGDSDRDGVPDGQDGPSQLVLEGTVYLVIDTGADTVGLADALGEAANVEVIAPDHLLANHTDARYIVILGDPAKAGKGTAGALTRTLLADAPDVLARLKDPSEADHIAIRYGKWAPNQTIVMLSRAYMSDHFRVIGLLKGVQVTVGQGTLTYACADPRPDARLDGIDVVKATGAAVWARFDNATTFSIEVAGLSETDLPVRLSGDTGLGPGEITLGRYVGCEVNASAHAVAGAVVWLYYTESDLDRTGDGDADDPVDIDERTLALYVLDEAAGRWTKLSTDLGWVLGTGVDTADRELYGTRYAGVLWANATHLSVFGAGGAIMSGVTTVARTGPDLTARAGDEVMFDGSASTGIGGIARYDWTFTERGSTVVLHGFRPVHTFKAPGTYAVTLLVEDAYGGTSEDAFNVTVGKAEAEKAPWGLVALAVVFLLVLAAVLWLVFTPVRPSGKDEKGR